MVNTQGPKVVNKGQMTNDESQMTLVQITNRVVVLSLIQLH